MAQAQRVPYISEEEYLTGETLSETRHEYVDGQVFAMAGATQAHNIISLNLAVWLRGHLRGSGCQVFVGDVKAQVKAINTYYYPDVMVSCGARNPKAMASDAPVLIVEVLSPSTETIDRREKLMNYRKIPTLCEYILVEQDVRRVEIYRLNDRQEWVHEIMSEAGVLELSSLPNGTCAISFDDIYEGVLFTPADESPADE